MKNASHGALYPGSTGTMLMIEFLGSTGEEALLIVLRNSEEAMKAQ